MDIKERIEEINAKIKADHKYVMSVSVCLDYLEEQFDSKACAERCYNKGFNDPNSKYYQMTVDDILKKWEDTGKESTHYGSLLDDYIGLILNQDHSIDEWKLDYNYDYDERLKGLCDGFDQFYKTLIENSSYRYVARELPLYIKDNNGQYINGRFDCLFYSPEKDRYMLIDWKSSKDIELKNNFGKKLKGPCYQLDACNGNRYTVQLQMYKKALTEVYGLTTPDKIDVFICRMSVKDNDIHLHYMLYKQNFEYSSDLLNKVIDYAYKKKAIEKSNS